MLSEDEQSADGGVSLPQGGGNSPNKCYSDRVHWSGKLVCDHCVAHYFFTLDKTKERAGDNETAIQLYGKAIEYCPENALVRYRRGKLLIGVKQYKVRECFRIRVLPAAHLRPARSPRFGVLERSLSR